MRRPRSLASALLLAMLMGSSGASAAPASPEPAAVTFVGAGDIASCYDDNDAATAALIEQIDGEVFTLGDNAYDNGTPEDYSSCYAPTWGTFADRTHPVPGNHDYKTADAAGYFAFFGDRAGSIGQGYYSFDLGAWHVIALNSNCDAIGGCGVGSDQLAWLEADLTKHPNRCSLAYMHHPHFSSAGHDHDADLEAIWQQLYAHGVELVMSGHDHTYERFAPQTPEGALDEDTGIVQFVVGTGGAPLREIGPLRPHSLARSSDTFGVLQLTLQASGYAWQFIPVAGETFTDSGQTMCH